MLLCGMTRLRKFQKKPRQKIIIKIRFSSLLRDLIGVVKFLAKNLWFESSFSFVLNEVDDIKGVKAFRTILIKKIAILGIQLPKSQQISSKFAVILSKIPSIARIIVAELNIS
jgi:hypothetical protein